MWKSVDKLIAQIVRELSVSRSLILNMGWMFTIAVMMCKPFWEVRVLPSATMAPCVIHSNFIIIKIETVINTLKTYISTKVVKEFQSFLLFMPPQLCGLRT